MLAAWAFVLFASAAAAETTPPQLVSMIVSPGSFDSSVGPVVVTVFIGAHDDVGFSNVSPGSGVLFAHESGSTIFGRQNLSVTAGSLTNPVFQFGVTIPQFSPPGQYRISVTLADSSQNSVTFTSSDLQARAFPSTLTITPSGTGSISLSPSAAPSAAAGRSGAIQVTTSSAGVTWSAVSSASWLTITSAASGAGNGIISYLVSPSNEATARIAIITVNGQNFTMTQAASAAALAATPTSLTFTYHGGGATPPPQTVTVFSSGSQLNFTTNVSSVGNWLFVSPTSGPTSTVMSVWVDPAGKTPGTYTGFVTLIALGSANSSVTLRVTLIVNVQSSFTISPATVSFSTPQGGSPAPRSLSIAGGSGSFTALAASSGWLAVNPGSGASPSTLTVSVSPSALEQGSYTGSITITGTTASVQTIPVSLTLTASQPIIVDPASLTFTYVIGADVPAPQSLAISGTAAGVSFSTTQGSWLTLGASSSPIPGGVTVIANPQGLPIGDYLSSIVVTTEGARPQTVPVSLIVTGAGVTLNPTSLSFLARGGVATPSSRIVTIGGVTAAGFSATASSAGAWLVVTPLSGTLPAVLSVSLAASGLAPGSYSGAVTILVSGSNPTVRTLPVSLTVEAAPPSSLVVTPSTIQQISYQTGDPVPASLNLSLSSTGQALSFTATASSTGNWLTVGPANGSTPASLAVQVNPAGLGAGSYSGTIQIASPGQTTTVVAISLNIRAPQDLTVSANSLSFAYLTGGPAPASQTLTIGCSGSALSFAASAGSAGNWLAATGSTAVNNQLIVSVNPAGLSIGSHLGTVTLLGTGACNRSRTIPVTLVVNAGAAPITSPPTSLSFSYQAGGAAPAAQMIPIACGGLLTNFSAIGASSGNWLRVSPSTGRTPATLTIAVQAAALAPGSYSGSLSIVTPASCLGTWTVPVNLDVSSAGPSPAPITSGLLFGAASLTFTAPAGGNAPTTQAVALTCSASAASFSATAVSTGGWLVVGPPSGNTPTALTVSVQPAGLAPGSYSGSIAANSPTCGSAAPLPVTLTVTGAPAAGLSITPASLTFHYQLGGPAPASRSLAISGGSGQSFTLTTSDGGSWLSATPFGATVPAAITVSVIPASLAAGTYSGAILFSAGSGASRTTQNIGVTLNVSGGPGPITGPGAAPHISSLVNAASLLTSPLAPGEIISIFGSGLGPLDPELLRLGPASLVASSVGGTRVIINGKPAPILFTQATQINTIVPYSAAGRSVIDVQVEFQGVASAAARLSVAEAAPAVFTLDGSGRGQAALLNENTTVNSSLNPAERGSIGVLYASGSGVMAPASEDGAITGPTLPRPVLPVSVLIDGQNAPILYAGGAPELVAGVLQVNFRIPTQIRTGSAIIVLLRVGRFNSQTGVTMAIR